MPSIENLIVVGGSVFAGVFVLVAVTLVLSRFYRRCGADEALVRTGSGGNKVVIGGGILVYPILHQLLRVSLRSVKLSVERSGKNALVTADKIKANVTTELYIKVEPMAEDVLAAARSFGERNLDEHAIGELIEGKLTDALRSVAANQTFMSLHGKRKEFAEHIQAALAEELKKNGLTLENVSITSLSMVQVRDLDDDDVFDAEGLRAITESVQTNREKTNQIQREKENQIHAQNVTARMRQLELEQAQKQAEADQARRVEEYAAAQQAEMQKAVFVQQQASELAAYEKQRAVETARIQQEQAIAIAMAEKQRAEREALIAAEKAQMFAEVKKQREIEAAEIEKRKALETAEIDRQKVIEAAAIDKERAVGAALVQKEQAMEVAGIEKVIAVTKSQEEQARAAASRAIALAEEEKARQEITTVEVVAKAEREREVAVIAAQAEAAVRIAESEAEARMAKIQAEAAASRARTEAESRVVTAEKESEAMSLLANAIATKGEAEATARRKMVEAENVRSMKLVLQDVAKHAIDTLPEVARELMAPAHSIKEIKVLHTTGSGASQGMGPMGAMSPVVRTLLDAGAAYPLMKELLGFADVDTKALESKARALLGETLAEVDEGAAHTDAPSVNATPEPSPKRAA
jgi:flotillin